MSQDHRPVLALEVIADLTSLHPCTTTPTHGRDLSVHNCSASGTLASALTKFTETDLRNTMLTRELDERKTQVSDLSATLEQERVAHRTELDAERAQCETVISSCVNEFIKMLSSESHEVVAAAASGLAGLAKVCPVHITNAKAMQQIATALSRFPSAMPGDHPSMLKIGEAIGQIAVAIRAHP